MANSILYLVCDSELFFTLAVFIQKEMHKNISKNSGPDSSDALHCLDTFLDTYIYTQMCVNFFK